MNTCASCNFWEQWNPSTQVGVCNGLRSVSDESEMAGTNELLARVMGGEEAVIYTGKDFGCTLHRTGEGQ